MWIPVEHKNQETSHYSFVALRAVCFSWREGIKTWPSLGSPLCRHADPRDVAAGHPAHARQRSAALFLRLLHLWDCGGAAVGRAAAEPLLPPRELHPVSDNETRTGCSTAIFNAGVHLLIHLMHFT